MKKKCRQCVTLILAAMLLVTGLPFSVYATSNGMTNQNTEGTADPQNGLEKSSGLSKSGQSETSGSQQNTSKSVSFAALDEAVSGRTVAVGTELEDLQLPKTLTATVSGTEEVIEIPVTWTADPEYNGDVPGNYVFTPKLPEGYTAEEGTELPSVKVYVESSKAAARNTGTVTLSYTDSAPFTLDPNKESNLILNYSPKNNGKEKVITLLLPRYFEVTAIPPDTDIMTIKKNSVDLEADDYWPEGLGATKLTITLDASANLPLELSFYMQLRSGTTSVISNLMWELQERAPELPFEVVAVLDEGEGNTEETKLTETPGFEEDLVFTTIQQEVKDLIYKGDNDVFANTGILSTTPVYDSYIMRMVPENDGEYHYPIQVDKIVVPCSSDIEKMQLLDKYVSMWGEVQEINGEPYAVFDFSGENMKKGSFWNYDSKMDSFPIIPRVYDFKESVVTSNNRVTMFREGPVEVTYTFLGKQYTESFDTSDLKLEQEGYELPEDYLGVELGPASNQNISLNRENSVAFTYSYIPVYNWLDDTKPLGETKIAPTYEGEFIINVPYEFRPTGFRGISNMDVQAVVLNMDTNETRTCQIKYLSGSATYEIPEIAENERITKVSIKQLTFESDVFSSSDSFVKNGVYYFYLDGYPTEKSENGQTLKENDKIEFQTQAVSYQSRLGQNLDVSATCTAVLKATYDQLILSDTPVSSYEGTVKPEILLSEDGELCRGTGISIYATGNNNTRDYTDVKIQLGYTGSEGASLFHCMKGLYLGLYIRSSSGNGIATNAQVHYKTNLGKEDSISSAESDAAGFLFELDEGEYVTDVWITMDRISGSGLDKGVAADSTSVRKYYKNSHFAIYPLLSNDRTYYDENGVLQSVQESSNLNPWKPGQITYAFTCAEGGNQQNKGAQEVTRQAYRPELFLYECYDYAEHTKSSLKITSSKAYYGSTLSLKDQPAVQIEITDENKEQDKINSQDKTQHYILYLEVAPGYDLLPNDYIKAVESKKLDNGNRLYRLEIELKSYQMEVLQSKNISGSCTLQLFVRPDAEWGETVQPVVAMAHDYAPYFDETYGETEEEMRTNPPYRVIQNFEGNADEIPSNWGIEESDSKYIVYKTIDQTIGADDTGLGNVMNYTYIGELPSQDGKFRLDQQEELGMRSFINVDQLGMYGQLTVEYRLPTAGDQTESGSDDERDNQMTLRFRNAVTVEQNDEPLDNSQVVYVDQDGKEYDRITDDNREKICAVRITFEKSVKGVLEVQMNLQAVGLSDTEINPLAAYISIKASGEEEENPTYITPVSFQLSLMKTSAYLIVLNPEEFVEMDKYGPLELKMLDENLEELMTSDGNGGEKPIEFTYSNYYGVYKMGYAPVPGDKVKYIAVKDISTDTESFSVLTDPDAEPEEQQYMLTDNKNICIEGEKYYYLKMNENYIREDADQDPVIPLQFFAKPDVKAEDLYLEAGDVGKMLPCTVLNEETVRQYYLSYELLDENGNAMTDSEVASVNEDGSVTAKAEGIVRYRVTAKTYYEDDIYTWDMDEARIIIGDPEMELSYTVEHYLDGVHQENDDVVVTENMKASEMDQGLSVTQESLEKTYEHYEFERMEPEVKAGDKVQDGTVIQLYYKKVSEPEKTKYTLNVVSGTGSGLYPKGERVEIQADPAPEGKVFDHWITQNGGSFIAYDESETIFVMPGNDVTVVALYKDADKAVNPGDPDGPDNSGNSVSKTSEQKSTTIPGTGDMANIVLVLMAVLLSGAVCYNRIMKKNRK